MKSDDMKPSIKLLHGLEMHIYMFNLGFFKNVGTEDRHLRMALDFFSAYDNVKDRVIKRAESHYSDSSEKEKAESIMRIESLSSERMEFIIKGAYRDALKQKENNQDQHGQDDGQWPQA